MTLSLVGSSAWVSGTAAVAPTNPTGLTAGDLVILTLVSKYDTAVLAADPAGWDTPGTPAANSGRPTGVDNGNTRMRCFYKVWQAGDSMPSLSPASNNVSTVHATAYRSTSGLYDVVAMPLADDTVGSPLAVTSPATALAPGDMILTDMVLNGDAPTWGTTTVTATGITFGSITTPTADASTTAGTDMRMRCMNRAVSAGTATTEITASTTLAGTTTNAVGTVNIVRVREVVPSAPAAPSGLTVVDTRETEVDLSWTDNSSDETGFRVEWSTNNFSSVLGSATVGPGVTTRTVTGLTASTLYYFRVYAYNGVGDSTASNVVSTTTNAPPSTVTVPWRTAGGAWSAKPLWRRSAGGAWLPISSLSVLSGGGGSTSNPTFVKQGVNADIGSASIAAFFSLPSAPTAGNLLIIAAAIDKNAGTVTPNGTWNTLAHLNTTSVTLVVFWKVSNGTETNMDLAWTTSSPAGGQVWYGEYTDSGNPSGTWSLVGSATHPSDDSAVADWSSGTTGATTAAGTALAFFAVDSMGTVTPSLSNSFTERYQGFVSGSGRGGLTVGEKSSVASGSTVETTISRGADQQCGAIGVFAKT